MAVLLAVPVFSSQLVSFQWSWTQGGGSGSQLGVALIHTLQLCVPWRLGRLIFSSSVTEVDKELAEVCSLRLFQTFASSLPLLVLETYLLQTTDDVLEHPLLLAAALGALLSGAWGLATYRKQRREYAYVTSFVAWPGTLLKVLWRCGELGSRVLILALFAGLYRYWVLLVIGLHALTMYIWLLGESALRHGGKIPGKEVAKLALSAYLFVFCYLNVLDKPSRYRAATFYFMQGLEGAVLVVLWLMEDPNKSRHLPLTVGAAGAFVVGLLMAVLYYNCFHLKAAHVGQPHQDTHYIHTCINCQLSCCVKHSMKMQRPFSPDWWEVKEQAKTEDGSPAPSDFSSASQTKGPQPPLNKAPARLAVSARSHYINPTFAYGPARPGPWDDSVSSTVFTDSQYLSEFTVDTHSQSHYGTGSEFVWDDYDMRRQSAPDLIDGDSLQTEHPAHQRSDSGFSASHSESKPSLVRTHLEPGVYTTDESDFGYTPAVYRGRPKGHYRHGSMDILYRRRRQDADSGESDHFSQSSVCSYPSSLPSRRPRHHLSREQKRLRRQAQQQNQRALQGDPSANPNALQPDTRHARRPKDKAGVHKKGHPQLTQQLSDTPLLIDTGVIDKMSVRATTPHQRSSRENSADEGRSPRRPDSKQQHTSHLTEQTLEQIIADVSKIAQSLTEAHLDKRTTDKAVPPKIPHRTRKDPLKQSSESDSGISKETDISVKGKLGQESSSLNDLPDTAHSNDESSSRRQGRQRPVWF